MTEGNELEEIMAEGNPPEPTPEPTTTAEPTPSAEQGRDELGRFAAKANAEGQPEPVAQPDEPAAGEPDAGKPGSVPQQALHAARQGEREARQENEALKTRLAQLEGQMTAMSRQLQQPPQPAQPKEQPKAPDFWENPNEFVNSALTPLQQQVQQQHERTSRLLAVQQHGFETVSTAYQEMGKAIQANPAMRSELQRIMQADHPYDELVKWHKRHQALSVVGDDPQKWLEAEMEKRLSDPAQQAAILERIRGSATANANGQPAPVTSLPPSLNRLPAGGNAAADNDVSDEGLFTFAMAR